MRNLAFLALLLVGCSVNAPAIALTEDAPPAPDASPADVLAPAALDVQLAPDVHAPDLFSPEAQPEALAVALDAMPDVTRDQRAIDLLASGPEASRGPDTGSGPDSLPMAPIPYESIPQCKVNGIPFTVSNAGSCASYSIPAGTPGISGQVAAIYPVLPSDAGVARQLTCMVACYQNDGASIGSITNQYTDITSVCRTEAYSADGRLWGDVVCLPKMQTCGVCVPALP
jgi:hypothetical protein